METGDEVAEDIVRIEEPKRTVLVAGDKLNTVTSFCFHLACLSL